jgi:hypothetical protein
MNPRDIIKRECAGLGLEETLRMLCPFCEGGKQHEHSLSCKRAEAGVLYSCKRAKCGKSGLVGGTAPYLSAKQLAGKIRSYLGALTELPHEIYLDKFEPFSISYETCTVEGIKYAPELNRIYFPVYDHRHYQIGEVLRVVDPGVKPKVLTNKFSIDVPFCHVPLCSNVGSRVVLVEDMVSAIRVSEVTPAIALLGTNIADDTVEQFRSIGIKKITLMLDGDAAGITASLKLQSRLRPFFETSVVLPPKHKDPKHLDCRYLETVLL